MFRISTFYPKPWKSASSDIRRKFYNALMIDYQDNKDTEAALKKMEELWQFCRYEYKEVSWKRNTESEFIVLLHNAGVFNHDLGRHDIAMGYFNDVLTYYPDEHWTFLTRATLKEDMGDLKGARADYEKISI